MEGFVDLYAPVGANRGDEEDEGDEDEDDDVDELKESDGEDDDGSALGFDPFFDPANLFPARQHGSMTIKGEEPPTPHWSSRADRFSSSQSCSVSLGLAADPGRRLLRRRNLTCRFPSTGLVQLGTINLSPEYQRDVVVSLRPFLTPSAADDYAEAVERHAARGPHRHTHEGTSYP